MNSVTSCKIETLLNKILDKAWQETPLKKEEILYLLKVNEKKDLEKIFNVAKKLRQRYFSKKVFFYGFVYFSTYCRNNCTFCFYRKSNKQSLRYRKNENEIIETACQLAESGVHLIDLTMGEDPKYFVDKERQKHKSFSGLIRLAEEIKKKTDLPIMLSPGVISNEILGEFKKIGIDWYACYQETHNRELFAALRIGQSYQERYQKKLIAHSLGILIEEGILTGIGDSDEDIVDSFRAMERLKADQLRVMSFVPQKGTPMSTWRSPNRMREMLIIAVLRLIFPDRLIPASLDVDGILGLKQRLQAGANVVTSIIPSSSGLAGVSQNSLDIREGHRTVSGVLPILEECGLIPAAKEDYIDWISKRKNSWGKPGVEAWK